METKGQEDLDVPLKMQRLQQWCADINRVQADVEYDFVYVDQESFDRFKPTSFGQLIDGFKEYKEDASAGAGNVSSESSGGKQV